MEKNADPIGPVPDWAAGQPYYLPSWVTNPDTYAFQLRYYPSSRQQGKYVRYAHPTAERPISTWEFLPYELVDAGYILYSPPAPLANDHAIDVPYEF